MNMMFGLFVICMCHVILNFECVRNVADHWPGLNVAAMRCDNPTMGVLSHRSPNRGVEGAGAGAGAGRAHDPAPHRARNVALL